MSWRRQYRIPNYFGDIGQYELIKPPGAYPDPMNIVSATITIGVSGDYVLAAAIEENSNINLPQAGTGIVITQDHMVATAIERYSVINFSGSDINFSGGCSTLLNPV